MFTLFLVFKGMKPEWTELSFGFNIQDGTQINIMDILIAFCLHKTGNYLDRNSIHYFPCTGITPNKVSHILVVTLKFSIHRPTWKKVSATVATGGKES